MKTTITTIFFTALCVFTSNAQDYNSFITGSLVDTITNPAGGVCLMGGASEDDNAMIWFLNQADHGDVLVLRASGSDGYNDYLYTDLGVNVNSVETIVFNNALAANDSYIHQKIKQAEAIWFAGGDQFDYVSYWRNTPIDSLINVAIASKNIVVGGTSAGMAIQGGFYFSAENGTVTSAEALADPYDTYVTVDSNRFISTPYMTDVITDSHYDDPDRKGRHLVFLARILRDYGIEAKGIACDEYTSVCIGTDGIAKVYGGYPDYDDNAYFIQSNCELDDLMPEDCSTGNPLDWNRGNAATKVYAVKGTSDGANTLDLNDWKTGVGGVWQHWYVENGVLNETAGTQPNCDLSILENDQMVNAMIYPNPAKDVIHIKFDQKGTFPTSIQVVNSIGQIEKHLKYNNLETVQLKTNDLTPGFYFIRINFENHATIVEKVTIENE